MRLETRKSLKCIKKETKVKIEQKFLWLTFIDGDVAVDVEKIEANDVETKIKSGSKW